MLRRTTSRIANPKNNHPGESRDPPVAAQGGSMGPGFRRDDNAK
jgi:hypothetical protein